MQDVVAYLMHVDGRHLQTVLNPAMHAHSQVLSAPSVNTEPSHSIRVIHGPSYGPIALASTGAGCPELSPPSGFHEAERRLGAVGHIAVQLAHLLQEVRATVDVRAHICAVTALTHLKPPRICAATRAASAPRLAPHLRRDCTGTSLCRFPQAIRATVPAPISLRCHAAAAARRGPPSMRSWCDVI
jgi:hypothetical protein